MRRRLLWIVPLVLMVVVGGWLLRTFWLAGSFRHIEPHFAGSCQLVAGVPGSEDITIHPRTGVAYISSSDRRVREGAVKPGAIYAYDLNQTDPTPVNLTPDADTNFQPHGISLWAGDSGDVLFVISHPPKASGLPRNVVEIFDVTPERLVHRATLTDPLLVTANDIVAVGIDRFYLTNTHKYPAGWRNRVETYLTLAGAHVLYYGPGGFRVALDGLLFPNGINVSPDGRKLYVASVTGREMLVYDRDPQTETLTPRGSVFLGSGPDNIEVDADGNAWIGAHPKLLRVGAHAENRLELSPSQVLRVSPDGRVDEIYMNRGEEISAASVAAVRGDRLLIGEIFDDGFLDCRMKK